MTITLPRWLAVLLALVVLGGGGFYAGYRTGDSHATSTAKARRATDLARLRVEAKREQRAAFRQSIQGNYRYVRGWLAPACTYVQRSTKYPYRDGDCPDVAAGGA